MGGHAVEPSLADASYSGTRFKRAVANRANGAHPALLGPAKVNDWFDAVIEGFGLFEEIRMGPTVGAVYDRAAFAA
jgi:hypothetical protein